jgi:hypothetical protein
MLLNLVGVALSKAWMLENMTPREHAQSHLSENRHFGGMPASGSLLDHPQTGNCRSLTIRVAWSLSLKPLAPQISLYNSGDDVDVQLVCSDSRHLPAHILLRTLCSFKAPKSRLEIPQTSQVQHSAHLAFAKLPVRNRIEAFAPASRDLYRGPTRGLRPRPNDLTVDRQRFL